MPPHSDSRDKMIASAAALLPVLGVHGTSFTRVLDHSGAPRGSIGHHFPGGKNEMLLAAISVAGGRVTRRLRQAADGGVDYSTVIGAFCDYFQEGLLQSEYRAGCPVAAVALDVDTDTKLHDAATDVIDEWTTILAEILAAEGYSRRDAATRAELSICAIEGALILCRLHRSVEALTNVRHSLRTT
ncbi:TetR/AcrR family transcriptional regulator [Gordonia hydrophobica]|uniref:TetR family transcriptional regulator n=1 Tax=Gordonia hydrophobica TaxID=40516 RepID=A0ABZ2U6V4_9ACTN|nr:TetR family transcriptional regulator [Gordonia hydrophobica]MBM7365354.1 AcrR family transcriptional regulator [Gordonia hydrophobica]